MEILETTARYRGYAVSEPSLSPNDSEVILIEGREVAITAFDLRENSGEEAMLSLVAGKLAHFHPKVATNQHSVLKQHASAAR